MTPAEIRCAACGHLLESAAVAICPGCYGDPAAPAQIPVPDPIPPVLNAPAVVLRVAGVQVRVAPGETVLLGRIGDERVRAALSRYPNVGRRHATVAVGVDGRVELCDLASRNGTWIGELRLDAHQPLRPVLPTSVRLGAHCFVELRASDD